MHIRKSNVQLVIRWLFLLIVAYQTSLFASVSAAGESAAVTYIPQTHRVTSMATVRDEPDGKIVAVWNPDTRFTTREQHGDWIKVSGTFPKDQWTPQTESLWVNRYYATTFTPQPGPIPSGRPKNISRYISVDKSDFTIKVFEQKEGSATEKEIYSTQVALGMDRCLPKEKGGKCYFTDPGKYQIRWKIHDPLGIEWCIPKSMEVEFKDDIEAGNRCFRGSIGRYALNIGKTYAIHGTANPASIGTKASHGCVRTANADMERIFNMMDVGDPVYITE